MTMLRSIFRMPRWWHHFYAVMGGYFWHPCPLCGRYYGGHEWDGRSYPVGQHSGQGYCSRHLDCEWTGFSAILEAERRADEDRVIPQPWSCRAS